jgi:hypothetical protein
MQAVGFEPTRTYVQQISSLRMSSILKHFSQFLLPNTWTRWAIRVVTLDLDYV